MPRPEEGDVPAAPNDGCAFLGGATPLASERYGLKAAWLDRALRAGEQVPHAFVVDVECAQHIAAGDPEACRMLPRWLGVLGKTPTRLSVRASPTLSLPGALRTQLDVSCDAESVRTALCEVVRSALSTPVREQLAARATPLPDQPWVAVMVQRYVRTCARGDFGAVAFTHEPHTGRHVVSGEYAPTGTADVVSGQTRCEPLAGGHSKRALAVQDANAFAEIEALAQRLEAQFGVPLELELARAGGQLWLLQARPLTLAPRALVRLALEAIEEDSPRYGRWLEELSGRGLEALLEQDFGSVPKGSALWRGLSASPGVASGIVVTDVGRALERAAREPIVLMRTGALPEDVGAFRVAEAVVTSSGGLTCHAALIARGLGIPAIVGCADVRVDEARGHISSLARPGAPLLTEGDLVSVDAHAGLVYRGVLPRKTRIADAELKRLFAEVRKLRPLPLWAFGDAEVALRLKEEACLDGALCTLPNGTDTPPARGRECWLELDARDVDARFSSLPPGWGVVLRGDLTHVSIAALRKAAPLRALGVRLEDPATSLPEGRLDALVLAYSGELPWDTAHNRSLLERADAARVLYLMNVLDPPSVAVMTALGRAASAVRDNVGWVYSTSHAAVEALRHAAQRLTF